MGRPKKEESSKKQASTVHLDTEVHDRLNRVMGLAMADGVKRVSYRMIITALVNDSSDAELIKAIKKQAEKEKRVA